MQNFQIDGAIDVHHHILPPEYVRIIGEQAIGRPAPRGLMPKWEVADSLRVMDAVGIGAAVTSVSAPGVWAGDRPLARKAARASNEFAAGMAAEHTGRFGWFATLPMPSTDDALAELAHAVDVLACDGVCLMSNYGEHYLGHREFEPLFAEIDARGLIAYVHPTDCACDAGALPDVPAAMIEFPHATTRCIVSLLNAGTFLKYPRIQFIFSHAGGTLPFLADRIASMSAYIGRPGWSEQMRRLHFDTAASTGAAAFASLLQLAPVGNILLGTDYPFVPEPGVRGTLAGLATLPINDAQRAAILSENSRRLFGRWRR
jgi:predicted TIM-barrel fold metal-dependent hydrolase